MSEQVSPPLYASTGVAAISASNSTFDRTVRVTGGPNITAGTDASGVSLSGAAQTVQTQNLVRAISMSDATKDQTVRITGAGNITVGSDASGAVVSGSQSVQPGVQNLIASDATFSSGTVSITGVGGGATVNTAASKIQVSVAAQSVQPGVANLVASDNTFSSGTVSITGVGGGATVNTAASKVQISVAAQTVQPVGSLSLSGNTAGTMANLPFASNLVLSATGGATLSQSSGASSSIIQLSVHTSQSVQPGVQNLVASDNTFSSGTVSVTGAGNITVNTAASKIQISGSQSVQTQPADPALGFWQNQPDNNLSGLSMISAISKTPIYFPVTMAGSLTPAKIGVRLAAVSSVASSVIQSFSVHFGLYSLVNSTSAALMGSASDSVNLSSTNSASYLTGRDFILTSPGTVAAISALTGGNYVMGLMFSGAANNSMAYSIVGALTNATSVEPSGQIYPGANSFSTGTTQGFNGFFGQGSSTVNAMPANVSVGDIRQQATATQRLLPYVYIRS